MPKKDCSTRSNAALSASRFRHIAHTTSGLSLHRSAVLSSDALSSVAYATEEVLRVLILVGAAALTFASPIAFVIAGILASWSSRTGRRYMRILAAAGAYIVRSRQHR
jgi:hypothetical protein